MKIFIVKNLYKIICAVFIISLMFVVFIRDNIDNEIGVMIIDYTFWFFLGLLCGYKLANYMVVKYLNPTPFAESESNKQ